MTTADSEPPDDGDGILQGEYAIDDDGWTVIGAAWVNLITSAITPMGDPWPPAKEINIEELL